MWLDLLLRLTLVPSLVAVSSTSPCQLCLHNRCLQKHRFCFLLRSLRTDAILERGCVESVGELEEKLEDFRVNNSLDDGCSAAANKTVFCMCPQTPMKETLAFIQLNSSTNDGDDRPFSQSASSSRSDGQPYMDPWYRKLLTFRPKSPLRLNFTSSELYPLKPTDALRLNVAVATTAPTLIPVTAAANVSSTFSTAAPTTEKKAVKSSLIPRIIENFASAMADKERKTINTCCQHEIHVYYFITTALLFLLV